MLYNKTFLLCVLTLAVVSSKSAFAEDAPKDWKLVTGAGVVYEPTFLGSNTYSLNAAPSVSLSYQDTFYASSTDGIGYNVIHTNGWQVGPILRYDSGRNEKDNDPFRIVGKASKSLYGLNNVNSTIEAGVAADYSWKMLDLSAELRQRLGGQKGVVADFSASLNDELPGPVYISVGPDLKVADSNYNQTFFGINSAQASRSGLPVYNSGGGVLSYGLSADVTIPFNKKVSATVFAAYDRLGSVPANSPLVEQLGSQDQYTAGMSLNYEFDW